MNTDQTCEHQHHTESPMSKKQMEQHSSEEKKRKEELKNKWRAELQAKIARDAEKDGDVITEKKITQVSSSSTSWPSCNIVWDPKNNKWIPNIYELPKGWTSGPHKNKYISGFLPGEGGSCHGATVYVVFEEAVEAANRTSDCTGITQDENGYTLRLGKKLHHPTREYISSHGRPIASWIK